MTYRLDSDVYHPYARVVKKSETSPLFEKRTLTSTSWNHKSNSNGGKKNSNLVEAEKPKLVAWVVSNCFTHSNRESFVRDLEKFIPIDIYGYCGDLTCIGETSLECYSNLAKSYKFYLAFENSLCIDYVTEKFFDSLTYDMVPIVYGRANYSSLAPPGSYIDARDFESPQALAKYLHYLDLHPEEYVKYFSWKENYQVVPSQGWCTLCTKLRNNGGTKSYINIWKWWHHVPENGLSQVQKKSLKDQDKAACLPIPYFESESWFSVIRKKYFILP